MCSKAHKLPKEPNLWKLLCFITNLLNHCNRFLLRFLRQAFYIYFCLVLSGDCFRGILRRST
ncbi:hypothetical protein DPV73_14665 [Leptospira mayottensis]|nr:hypothetical protein DPV73_14665 [Leptospira mayottensis]